MLKHLSMFFALSLTTATCTEEAALPRLVEAPLPDTATLQVDSAFIPAADWYFSGETDKIYLLRGDSLFVSPAKPLRWQWLGADPSWHGRTIFRVYKTDMGVAVLFTFADDETETGKAPLLWFSGQKTEEFSPATPVAGHRWQLIPEPVLPGNKGLFLYLCQDSINGVSRQISFLVTTMYWLSLADRTLTRLPFQQKPEFYDTSMRFAFFQTGSRLYPEENQFHPTFHRFDTHSGKIDADVPDLRLKASWCIFHCDPWDERPCLIERWGTRENRTGFLLPGACVEGLRLPDGRFIRLELPRRRIWDQVTPDSLWADAYMIQYSDSGENLFFSTADPHRIYVASKQDGARAELLEAPLHINRFGAFPNGRCYTYSKAKEDPPTPFISGSLFLYDRAENTRIDMFKHLRRAPTNPDTEVREVFEFNTIDIAGFLPSPVQLCKIRQGFIPKLLEKKANDSVANENWTHGFGYMTDPLSRDRMSRYAFLHQDGRLTLIDLPFLNEQGFDFQTLLFHPSGAILARDWHSGNLKWWGFEVP